MSNSDDAFKARYGRPRPTERERQTAARIFVRAASERGDAIPGWIRDLATTGPRGLMIVTAEVRRRGKRFLVEVPQIPQLHVRVRRTEDVGAAVRDTAAELGFRPDRLVVELEQVDDQAAHPGLSEAHRRILSQIGALVTPRQAAADRAAMAHINTAAEELARADLPAIEALPGWRAVRDAIPQDASGVEIHLFMTYPSTELENADGQPVSPAEWLRRNQPSEPVVQLARQVFDS